MSDIPSGQISGFANCHQINDVFTNNSNDNCPHSLVDLTKPTIFDDQPFEGSRTR